MGYCTTSSKCKVLIYSTLSGYSDAKWTRIHTCIMLGAQINLIIYLPCVARVTIEQIPKAKIPIIAGFRARALLAWTVGFIQRLSSLCGETRT